MNIMRAKHKPLLLLIGAFTVLLFILLFLAWDDFAVTHSSIIDTAVSTSQSGESRPDPGLPDSPRQSGNSVDSASLNEPRQDLRTQRTDYDSETIRRSFLAADTQSDRYDELSPMVFDTLEQAHFWQLQGDHAAALEAMNSLYAQYDSLNPFEQKTLLNYYSNSLLSLQMWQEAISAFSQLLTVPDLQTETYKRTLRSLGQIHGATGDREAAIHYLTQWMQETENDPDKESQREAVTRQLSLLNSANAQ